MLGFNSQNNETVEKWSRLIQCRYFTLNTIVISFLDTSKKKALLGKSVSEQRIETKNRILSKDAGLRKQQETIERNKLE